MPAIYHSKHKTKGRVEIWPIGTVSQQCFDKSLSGIHEVFSLNSPQVDNLQEVVHFSSGKCNPALAWPVDDESKSNQTSPFPQRLIGELLIGKKGVFRSRSPRELEARRCPRSRTKAVRRDFRPGPDGLRCIPAGRVS